MRGSCLCGACVFELAGRISAVGKCHCSKCRKASGTGSNAVHWARPENVGAERVREYERNGWGSAFCGTCGSPLPRMDPEKTRWFVPAGLLDGDPGVGACGHVWTSSKPSWEVVGDDAPQFEGNAPAVKS
jgi:hypothetical protein